MAGAARRGGPGPRPRPLLLLLLGAAAASLVGAQVTSETKEVPENKRDRRHPLLGVSVQLEQPPHRVEVPEGLLARPLLLRGRADRAVQEPGPVLAHHHPLQHGDAGGHGEVHLRGGGGRQPHRQVGGEPHRPSASLQAGGPRPHLGHHRQQGRAAVHRDGRLAAPLLPLVQGQHADARRPQNQPDLQKLLLHPGPRHGGADLRAPERLRHRRLLLRGDEQRGLPPEIGRCPHGSQRGQRGRHRGRGRGAADGAGARGLRHLVCLQPGLLQQEKRHCQQEGDLQPALAPQRGRVQADVLLPGVKLLRASNSCTCFRITVATP